MSSKTPIYLLILVIAIVFFAWHKISNPYRKYSTSDYWQTATVRSVEEIPDEAILEKNKNGPVLMWAAIGGSNPEVLTALVERGADINEGDGIFKGTPLTGAAGYSKNPEMIDRLIELGADINKTVWGGNTALIIAAQYNENPGITAALLRNGATRTRKNSSGKTALDVAKAVGNEIAIRELQ